ncbi:hypothetical protein HFN89_01445 [Rhizobium laguerreae]|nr:hypothetical protein [Rhizobium laguerreae]
MTSKKTIATLLAIGTLFAASVPATAGYNSREETPEEARLDLVVTPFRKDGIAGSVIEFNPITIPGQRCVVFKFGEAGGMQCFPDTGRSKTEAN